MAEPLKKGMTLQLKCEGCGEVVMVMQGGDLAAGIVVLGQNTRVRAVCGHCGVSGEYPVRRIETV